MNPSASASDDQEKFPIFSSLILCLFGSIFDLMIRNYVLENCGGGERIEQMKVAAANYWGGKHDFFKPDKVSLGLDMGIEGIGICIRLGKEILFCKSLLVDLPEAKALAKRRQFRASRHARKNRRVRMRRLKELFEQHEIPWVDGEIMSRSDPYKLRYRATTGKLASREALSICIRSIVAHRGYDYDFLKEKGDYLWGTSTSIKEATSWVRVNYINVDIKRKIEESEEDLTNSKGDSPGEEELLAFRELLVARLEACRSQDMPHMLKNYAKSHVWKRKARGMNFPRSLMRAHLDTILKNHKELIPGFDAFRSALFLPCDSAENKEKSIFEYQRKTKSEMEAHFHKKVKECPFASWLGLPSGTNTKCCQGSDGWFRMWRLVEFLSVRTFFIIDTSGKAIKRTLPGNVVRSIVEKSVDVNDLGGKPPMWNEVKKSMIQALTESKCKKLDDKSLSKDQKAWNKAQCEALKELCSPSVSSRKSRASLCSASSEALYKYVTSDHTVFDPETIEARKKEKGLYQRKQEISLYGGVFPQVSALLDIRGLAKGKGVQGLLPKLFEEKKDQLRGKNRPDYVIIECVRSGARNQDQKKEIEKEQKDRQKNKERLYAKYQVPEAQRYGRSKYLRLLLWEQQGGDIDKNAICPFTRKELKVGSPLSDELELAHLYPDTRGGLYIADNLVLTTRAINSEMGDLTPAEAADAGKFGIAKEEMFRASASFDWGKMKRYLFEFEPTENSSFPDFNNLTRVSQLASELRRSIAAWLGIASSEGEHYSADALRTRIGNPHGMYTAAMRRTLLPDLPKDRDTHTHHRVDAALLSCMPPDGLNSVFYKGMFYTKKDVPYQKSNGELGKRRCLFALIEGIPLPDLTEMLERDEGSPVMKIRSESKCKSLGDSTFWRVDSEGHTWQRKLWDFSKIKNAQEVIHLLGKMNIPCEVIPSERDVQKWLDHHTPGFKGEAIQSYPLKLKNGVPIKSVWNRDGKGSLCSSPMKWSGMVDDHGVFQQMRSLNMANDRLELWIGWNPKKASWVYQTRVVPSRESMKGIKRLGMPWRTRYGAPEYLIQLLDRSNKKSLKELVCGSLLPHSIYVGSIRKGFVVKVMFKPGQDKGGQAVETWGSVASIMGNGQIEVKSMIRKDLMVKTFSQAEDIARFLGFPSAQEYAEKRKWKHEE